MPQFVKHFVQDLTQDIKIRQCGTIVFNADDEANVITIDLYNGEEPATLTGSVVGAVICSDGSTVPVTGGTISGNTVTLILTGDCGAIPGPIGVGVQIVNGTQKTTVLKAVYNVEPFTTDNVVDPGSRITITVSDLVQDIADAVATIPADYTDLLAAVAPNYSGLTFPVKAGTLCWYNGALYQAKQDIATSESWTAAHWDSAVLSTSVDGKIADVQEEVSALKSAVNDSTGNIEIQFSDYTLRQYIDTSGSVIPWDSQTDKPITSTAANNEKWAIVECNPGDTFTISGRGGSADRFWAFADENKNILDPRAVASDRATELLIVAPEKARYLIINDKDNKMSYYGELVKQDVSAIKNANINVVGYERPYFNRKTFINWVSSSEMWEYGAYANNATTPAGILYPLKTGDSIELTDYSGVVFHVCTSNGQEYNRYINLTNKFTATEDCNAAISIQYNPGVALNDSNYSSLVNRVYIVHNIGIYYEIKKTKEDIDSRIDGVNAELSKTKNLTIESNIKSIAHRGYSYQYPENTEIAFIKAAQEGFKFVETDIRLTSDGIPVLLHDDTINRTGRNADGTQISQTISIADITYQQALQYDFGVYAGTQFAGQKILSFDKFMGLCRDLGLQTLLEIKLAEAPAVCQPIIDAYDMNDNVIYLGLISYIDYVYNQNPNAKYAVLVNTITDTIIASIKEKRNLGKNVIMAANYGNITPELFEAVKSENIPLIVFTINNDDTILNLDPYIGGVISDYKNAGVIIYNHYMSLLP